MHLSLSPHPPFRSCPEDSQTKGRSIACLNKFVPRGVPFITMDKRALARGQVTVALSSDPVGAADPVAK